VEPHEIRGPRPVRAGRARSDRPAPAPLPHSAPARNEKPAAIATARPRRLAPSRWLDNEGDGAHLPAFLLRPFRVKA